MQSILGNGPSRCVNRRGVFSRAHTNVLYYRYSAISSLIKTLSLLTNKVISLLDGQFHYVYIKLCVSFVCVCVSNPLHAPHQGILYFIITDGIMFKKQKKQFKCLQFN